MVERTMGGKVRVGGWVIRGGGRRDDRRTMEKQ